MASGAQQLSSKRLRRSNVKARRLVRWSRLADDDCTIARRRGVVISSVSSLGET